MENELNIDCTPEKWLIYVMYIFLDESGDLGFDFIKPKTSKYLVICLLLIRGKDNIDKLKRAVKRTIKNKLNRKGKTKNPQNELKGSSTNIKIKDYFWRQLSGVEFDLFAVVLNKRNVFPQLQRVPDRLYNYLAKFVMDKIIEKNNAIKMAMDVNFVIDRSKNKEEIEDFNNYLQIHIKANIDPRAKLDINHSISHEEKGLQAVDMFCWGIYRKFEEKDYEWYNYYKHKIKFETLYLP